jgi:hypothetical protein
MEDTSKVSAKITALQTETSKSWLAAPNTVHVIDNKGKAINDIKTFICKPTGEVREYPVTDYQTK